MNLSVGSSNSWKEPVHIFRDPEPPFEQCPEKVRYAPLPQCPPRFRCEYHPALTPFMYAWLHQMTESQLLELWKNYLYQNLDPKRATRWYRWLRNGMYGYARRRTLQLYRPRRAWSKIEVLTERFFRLRPRDIFSPIQSIWFVNAHETWVLECGRWFEERACPEWMPVFLARAPLCFRWATLHWWLLYTGLAETTWVNPHHGFPSYIRYQPDLIALMSQYGSFTESALEVLADWLQVPYSLFYSVPAVRLDSGTVLTLPPVVVNPSPTHWLPDGLSVYKWLDKLETTPPDS